MLKHIPARTLLVAASFIFVAFLPIASLWPRNSRAVSQNNSNPAATTYADVDYDGWGRPIPPPSNQKAAPAPKHDISGTWDPANGPDDGGQFLGAKTLPVDGKPGHEPPYTKLGMEAYLQTKPSNGARMVPPGETNDPEEICNPQGFPREELFQFRTTQIVQTPAKVLILYEYDRVWRTIWTDGRALPKDPEPRWFGYSVGKWADDYTFVVETAGTDDRTWVDHAGRPHTSELRVEERFHRVDHDRLELSMLIDDPKMYTKPWLAMDKFPMRLLPDDLDVREMLCSPSDLKSYNDVIGDPVSEPAAKKEH
jgi:hypothetical protein